MTVHASVRIRMEDRPGALSAVGAALAANGVDIVRLDVVSHDGREVIDDLFLAAASPREIDRALASFFTDVHVTRMTGSGADPVVAMANALHGIASADDPFRVQRALLGSAATLFQAENAALVSAEGEVVAGSLPPGLALADAGGAAEATNAMTFHSAGRWLAAVAVDNGVALVLDRPEELPFFYGELARLSAYARAAAAVRRPPIDAPV